MGMRRFVVAGMLVPLSLCASGPAAGATATEPNLKVAFIGDQGLSPDAEAVLRLIRDEGTDLVVHLGDFDYDDSPEAWDAQINKVLGESFPYIASLGNHDDDAAPGYQAKLDARRARVPDLVCSGETAIQQTCDFRGLRVILVAPGEFGSGHAAYLRDRLAESDHIWSICGWHRNMTLMQTGSKRDDTGWGVYEECRLGGGIVATAHEHSYARSYLMTDIEAQQYDPTTGFEMTIRRGQTFVFHSGIGGHSIREQQRHDPWWAAVWNADTDADHGALFCEFNIHGVPERAYCYFKDIRGRVPDAFALTSAVETEAAEVLTISLTPEAVVKLREAAPDQPHASAPSVTVDGDEPRRSGQATKVLIRFDAIGTGADQVPPGAKVLSAKLRLHNTDAGAGASVHRMLAPWTEADSWASLGDGMEANGIEAEALPDLATGKARSGWRTFRVTSAVQAWADGAPDYGWALLPLGSDGWDFATREGEGAPELQVEFTPPDDGAPRRQPPRD